MSLTIFVFFLFFGVTVSKWQNPILNPITGETIMTNNSARAVSAYGIITGANKIDSDINKAGSAK